MREILRNKIIAVCENKIEKKGTNVGLSFYAFFANKNDEPALLMEAAQWWIMTHKLDHFEKAVKIKALVESEYSVSCNT
ncbi:DUF6500 family protein [Moritella sp. 28]|uniref:DUF6500 family protein n=1 Tax=Moritella sp. 28 TaxID=2746232 RepID=UPI001BA6EB3D|nr:DUF6500 family protein [Moritella sp. 28]QUM84804.1 hypothetical protein HWV02_09970 [Moritella sp. 28]